MAELQYDISASYVGDGFESTSVFQFFYDNCGNPEYIVEQVSGGNTFTKTQIETGVTLVIPDSAQTLYLLPISQECPLGCAYIYSSSLSGYVAPTPTPTPSSTTTPTPTATPDVCPTPTPSNSGPALPNTYGTHTFTHDNTDITITWPTATPYYTKYNYAQSLANYLTNSTVSVSTNPTTPNEVDLDFSFKVYEEDLATELYNVNEQLNSKVWFYGNAGTNTLYLKVTNLSIGDPQGNGPTEAGILGYLEG